MNKAKMRRFIIPLLLLFLTTTLWLKPAWATGVYDLPSPDGNWIIDQAEVINRTNEGKINSSLEKLAKTTGKEVRMVAIRRLDYGETIDSLSDELFDSWFPSKEAQANQTLLVVDTLTNNAAIRTGEAVKNLIPEETGNSIVTETVGFSLRDGNNKYNQAFLDAGDRLVAILSGEPDPGPPEIEDQTNLEGTFTEAKDTKKGSATFWVIGLLILATIIPMATYYFYVGFSN
jgi:uncharacterized protein